MLLTIHNLPPRMRYGDVKSLIVSKCGFKDIILDNMINEGRGTKQVTVGLAAEEDAAMLVRQINGLYVEGKQLYVQDVRQKNQSKQPYRQTQDVSSYSGSQRGTNQSSSYTNPGNAHQPYGGQQMYINQLPGHPGQPDPMMMPMPYVSGMGGMMYMPPGQNSYMDYAGQTQQRPSSATQYTSMSGEQAQTGSGSGYQNYTDDKWSRDRHAHQRASHENRNQSSYKSDSRQQFRDNNTSRRRSRSPHDRDRSRGSPKRGRYDEGDFRSYSGRESQRHTPDRAETYTSQNYDSRNQRQPFFNNEPETSNKSLHLNTLTPNRWNSGPNQQQKDQRLDQDSGGHRSQNWKKNQKSAIDEKSNYRKHLESKQNQSKSVWQNPMQTSWGRQDEATSREEIQSQPSHYKRTNQNLGVGEMKSTSNPQSRGPVELRQSLLGNSPQKIWEPNKNAPKPGNVTNYAKQKPAKSKMSKGKKKGVIPTLKEDSILRYRAAVQIANEIAKEHINIISKEFYLKNLRKSVRSRLEVLLDVNIGMPLDQMIKTYRMTFPSYTDRDYCKAVVEQIPADVRAKIEATGENVDVAKLNISQPKGQGKKQPTASKNKPTANKNQSSVSKTQPGTFQTLMNLPVLTNLKPPNPSEKLPKYPQGDKQIYKEQKKLKKLEHGKEDIYTLPQPMQRVVDEELQALVDIYKSVVKTADNEQEQALCERFSTIGVDITRKVLKLSVTKRLLCINTNLVVRVYINGKPPKKLEVEEFMRKNGAVSCKKSVKRSPIYVATCRDFAAFDRLCGMGTVPMNAQTSLIIKPFQLAGPKLSFKERKELRERRLLGLEGSSEPTPVIPEEDDYTHDALNPIGRFEDPGESDSPGEFGDPGQSEDREQSENPEESEDPAQLEDLEQDTENDTNDAPQDATVDDMELNEEDFEDYY